MSAVRHYLTSLGVATANPLAFAVVGIYGVSWWLFGHLDLHGIATLATWFMTLVIQRAEHRDTQAIHAKLDELLHATVNARNSLTRVDEAEPEEIETTRKQMRQDD